MAENDIHVLGYAEPVTDEVTTIPGYEMVGAAQAQGLIDKQLWYIEGDAREKAAELAGRPVKLPYFFIGDPPEGGGAWPAHRRGGLRFMEKWIAGRAGPTDAEAPAPEAVEDHPADAGLRVDEVEGKLKAERKTTRALRRELKEMQERVADGERFVKATADRNEKQANAIHKLSERDEEKHTALVRIQDRVVVALELVQRIGVESGECDHAIAELQSALALSQAQVGQVTGIVTKRS